MLRCFCKEMENNSDHSCPELTVAPSTLPSQCGNHAPIFLIAVCVKLHMRRGGTVSLRLLSDSRGTIGRGETVSV